MASSGLFHDRVSVSENVMNRGLGSRFMHIHMHTVDRMGGLKQVQPRQSDFFKYSNTTDLS